MNYGILTILPAILVFICAVKTKKTTESLLLGVFVSYVIVAYETDQNILTLMTNAFFSVLTDYDSMWMIIVCGLFGSVIALMNEAQGTFAVANFLEKICKTGKSTLVASWILGIIIFVDDYMNIMTIGACTKKLADKRKVPREALAYVIDSTGAPICVFLPFSTWAIFFSGVFYEQDSIKNLGYGTAMETYMHIVPYLFYAIVAVIIVPLFIMGVIPKLGTMKRAYQRVEKTGMVYSDESSHLNQNYYKKEKDNNTNIWDFIVPIATMVAVQLVTGDMFVAIVLSIVICAILYLPRKKITGDRFCELWIGGFAEMIPTLSIIIAALYMRQASADLHLPDYIIQVVQPYVNIHTYPLIAFIVVSILGFITGSNWGIPAVCAPIIIPLGAAINANLLLVMAAILSGATFCSHACFYSDATVLTSSICNIENMDHVYSQLPYALIAFIISCVAYLISGFMF